MKPLTLHTTPGPEETSQAIVLEYRCPECAGSGRGALVMSTPKEVWGPCQYCDSRGMRPTEAGITLRLFAERYFS